MLYTIGVLAGFAGLAGFCPWGHKRPCPDPLIYLLGLPLGAATALTYDFTFLGTRAPEVPDLFCVALIASLFSLCIKTLFFTKKET